MQGGPSSLAMPTGSPRGCRMVSPRGGRGSLFLLPSSASGRGRMAAMSTPRATKFYAAYPRPTAPSILCTRMARRGAESAQGSSGKENEEDRGAGGGGSRLVPRGPWPQYLAAMAVSGAALGPFIDGYHSAFGVLAYTNPIPIVLGGVQVVVSDWFVHKTSLPLSLHLPLSLLFPLPTP